MQKFIINISIPLILCFISLALYHHFFHPPAIAIVRSALVIDQYKGFDEVNKFLNQRKQAIQLEIDSMQKQANLPEIQKQALYQKVQKFEVDFKMESERLNQTVLEKINQFIAVYGKEHHYNIIFGTTLSGNILHADQEYDITEEVIDALNTDYEKGN